MGLNQSHSVFSQLEEHLLHGDSILAVLVYEHKAAVHQAECSRSSNTSARIIKTRC